MIATVAMMVSCNNSGNQGSGAANGDNDENYSFSVQNGITGTTGTKNCHIPELGATIKFEAESEGDIVETSAKITLKHSDKTEIEEMTRPAELWISGKDKDNEDVKLTLIADEDSQAKLAEWLKAAPGTELEVEFEAKLPKADMDKLNAKQTTNTLVL